MSMEAGAEQRRDRRVAAQLPLVVRRPGVDDTMTAVTETVSARGLSFVSPMPLPMGQRLEFTLELPGQPAPVELSGTVVRCIREFVGTNDHEYGIRLDLEGPFEPLVQFVRSVDVLPLLKAAQRRGASVLHLTGDAPPLFRVGGEIEPLEGRVLSYAAVEAIVHGMMPGRLRAQFAQAKSADFPYLVPDLGRWRVNAYYQRGHIEATIRTIETEVPTLDMLELPPVVRDLAHMRSGLVLITGPRGSGKSTSMAAMIDAINRNHNRVITTVEDPIEFMHRNERSVVKQREVGVDCRSVAAALRDALRQDPDVIAVSDMGDAESLDMLLRALEMGFLVIVCLPSHDVVKSVHWLMALASRDSRNRVLEVLSANLQGIISQRLIPRLDGAGPVLALDVFTLTEGLRAAIRNDRLSQVASILHSGPGALSMDVTLRNLVMNGIISIESALQAAPDPDRFKKFMSDHMA